MRRQRAHGLSMIELLVGTAVGLLVVAAATSVIAAHQRDLRRTLSEARLMQDLRTTSGLVARDLRRAGYWSAAASGVRVDGDGTVPIANPHSAIAPALDASNAVALSFSNGAGAGLGVDDSERFGFRLRAGSVELQLGAGNWQSINDPATLVVTSFRVEPHVEEISLGAFCAAPCAALSATCPPRQQIRSFDVTLAARSATDVALVRTLRTSVRARSDAVVGSCEG